MMRMLIISLISFVIFASSIFADSSYFIIPDGINMTNQSQLSGFTGRCWGKTFDNIYLYGTDTDLNWLDSRGISYQAKLVDGEPTDLYYYSHNSNNDIQVEAEILDSGEDYIVTKQKQEIVFSQDQNLHFRHKHTFITIIALKLTIK